MRRPAALLLPAVLLTAAVPLRSTDAQAQPEPPEAAPRTLPGADAGNASAAHPDDVPATIAALRARGARTFALGERGGLAGHLVELAGGGAYALYLTPDGYAVAGLLYAPDGTLLTGGQLAAVRPGSVRTGAGGAFGVEGAIPRTGADASAHMAAGHATTIGGAPGAESRAVRTGAGLPAGAAAGPDTEARIERAASAFGFTLGRTGPLAVLFGDPGCRWSRSAAARLGRQALAGRLRLRVVPVGLLGAASARTAAGIASSPDPAAAWFGGDVPAPQPEGAERIARNNALYEAWGETGVPLISWRDARGRAAHRVGDVDDLEAWLRELPDE